MSLGRLIPFVSAVVLAGAGSLAHAQAKQPAPAPAPAPAGAGEGSAVQPIEDEPPADMEGTSEDPDAPRGTIDSTPTATTTTTTAAVEPVVKKSGYPIEEAERPITLPVNMAELSIAPHFMSDPFTFSDALRARYGITRQVQLGLTYVYGGAFDDPTTTASDRKFKAGKTAGFDVTVLITNFLAVKVGLPVYFDPFAMSFAAGAPLKFRFGKFALGGMDDIVNIRIKEFAPRYDYEQFNQVVAEALDANTETSRGYIRFSAYGIYQKSANLAIIGRVGIENDLGSGGSSGLGTGGGSGATTFLKGGVQFSPKKFFDIGALAGFEDLSRKGSFGLTGFLAVRI